MTHIVQAIGHFGGGGAERLAHNLAKALAAQGVTATCLALRTAGEFVQDDAQVRIVDLGIGKGLLSRCRGLLRWRRFVRHHKPDLVHVHGPQSLVFLVLGLTGLRHKPRIWFTWHDSGAAIANASLKRSTLRAMQHCDAVFGSSRKVVAWLDAQLQQAGGKAIKPTVFLNGVPESPASRHVEDDCPTIIWAARLVPPKDPQILIRAAATLRDEGLRFRIILAGSGYPHLKWFEDQTRQLVEELNLNDCVELPGWVDDVAGLYQQAAIGVQTSHTEGLSMTLLEQMMAGLAVVATDVGDTAVAIGHETTGLLIPPQDEQALTAALRRLITDLPLRKRLATAARQKALAEVSLEAMAQQVLALRSSAT